MKISLILSLVIAALAIMFAMQNAEPVNVHLFKAEFEGSLALVLLITFAIGILVSFLISLPALIKDRLKFRNQRKKLTSLEIEMNETKSALEDARSSVSVLEEELKLALEGELVIQHVDALTTETPVEDITMADGYVSQEDIPNAEEDTPEIESDATPL